ncbi:MAG: hypothetical protein WCW87_02040 [Candidatus Paceibacterota bacterium]
MKLWFNIISILCKLLTGILLTLWFFPGYVVRYWYVALLVMIPFCAKALYMHSWCPYIWIGLAVALGVMFLISLIDLMNNFPNS